MGISAVDFDYLRKLMRDHTAIVLDAGKEYIAESRLANLVSNEGFKSIPDLIRQLRSNDFTGLHRRVVNAMTNNETWFFRDIQPYQAVLKVMIPALTAARATERTIRIWSAACSTGQEPYSLAMLLRENFPELRTWNVRILATDISGDVLEKAQQGRYSQLEVNRGLPINLLTRYFHREGMAWGISQELRDSVQFQQINLSQAWSLMPQFDIIFLRNVLIYFDVEMKKEILRRVRRQIRPDGYMIMGGAETTLNLNEDFERVQYQTTAYYRPR
ncbi:MAG TPA: protein-glutamate O-methyltransferase CheR [Terriglobales bacterium]|nr:protein-glutamate O-methyltransferase CheR [Terriglobales bacterium]